MKFGKQILIQGLEQKQGKQGLSYLSKQICYKIQPSTLLCPITTKIQPNSTILRVHLQQGMANLDKACDIMIDQLRAIDNKRLIKKIGSIPTNESEKVKNNLLIVLDLFSG